MKGEHFVIPAGKIKTVVFDKPLHVRVAEKLGWTAYLSKHGHFIVTHADGTHCEEGFGRYDPEALYDSYTGRRIPERTDWWEDCSHVPRYDTDWSATGPLIEKYGLDLEWKPNGYGGPGEWEASAWLPLRTAAVTDVKHATGNNALEAVCNLILALPDEVVKG